MIYCLNCNGEIFLTKEKLDDYLVCFDETFEDIILFIENPFKLGSKKFRNIFILVHLKNERLNTILNNDLIDEKIKKKIKLYFNI